MVALSTLGTRERYIATGLTILICGSEFGGWRIQCSWKVFLRDFFPRVENKGAVEKCLKKPIGITILAITLFIYGVVCAYMAVVEYPSLRGEVPVALLWGARAISPLILAVCLWFHQEYGRWGLLLYAGRYLVKSGYDYLVAPLNLKVQFLGPFVLYAFVLAALVHYLTRTEVKRAFGTPVSKAHDPDAGKFAWPD